MKTAAKIFLIIGIISYAILALLLVGIVPLVFNIIGLVMLNKMDTSGKRSLWGILTLLLGCNIAGIFMFFMKDEDAIAA